MKERLTMLAGYWLAVLAAMAVQKPLFMLAEPAYGAAYLAWAGAAMWHGLAMDASMSAYLAVPVALWLIASVWVRRRWMEKVLHGWMWVTAAAISAAAVTDAMLYPYWNFRLDSTPVFYFLTSPGSALASVAWYWEAAGAAAIALLAWAIYKLLRLVERLSRVDGAPCRRRWLATAVLTVAAGLLIIPIRGGVTVSTMAPGRVYFSQDMKLNHAALNPLFTFVHSLAHADRLGSQFRYMDESQAAAIVEAFVARDPDAGADSVRLKSARPDIHLIILESFSAHLLPTLGGEAIAPRLDELAREGVTFTDFYAESFRTDRALATILSGYPALPTTSVFRYPKKFGSLPSLAASLKKEGYSTSYYYGGDVNFTNMKGYLVATGFEHIVSDEDFPVSRRLSKWGAHDEDVFRLALEENPASPALKVIQTSSSHEPFDVPFARLSNKRANAFAYADSCLGAYTDALKASGAWDNALVVIVADHWGGYPEDLTDERARHHVPLVLTGGALAGAPARIDRPGSQSAIAPTVLGLLGVDSGDFYMARSLLDGCERQYAWYNEPAWAALHTGAGTTIIATDTGEATAGTGRTDTIKAMLTRLYRDLDSR